MANAFTEHVWELGRKLFVDSLADLLQEVGDFLAATSMGWSQIFEEAVEEQDSGVEDGGTLTAEASSGQAS